MAWLYWPGRSGGDRSRRARAGEDSAGVVVAAGSFESPEQLEEFARNRGHGFSPAHAVGEFAVIIVAIERSLDHALEHGLGEDVTQSGPAALALAVLTAFLAALVGPQVEAAVAPELADVGKVLASAGRSDSVTWSRLLRRHVASVA